MVSLYMKSTRSLTPPLRVFSLVLTALCLPWICPLRSARAQQDALAPHDPYGALELVFSRQSAEGRRPSTSPPPPDPWAIADTFIAPSAVPAALASSFDRTEGSMVNGFVGPPVSRAKEEPEPLRRKTALAGKPVRAAQAPVTRDLKKAVASSKALARYQRASAKSKPTDDAGAKWVPLPSILKPTP